MPDAPSNSPQSDLPSQKAPQRVPTKFKKQRVKSRVIESLNTGSDVASTYEDAERKKVDKSWSTLFVRAPEIAEHTVTLLLSLLSLGILHLIIYWIGDPKFFGLIPVKWIVEVGDLVLLIKFIWHLIKDFNK